MKPTASHVASRDTVILNGAVRASARQVAAHPDDPVLCRELLDMVRRCVEPDLTWLATKTGSSVAKGVEPDDLSQEAWVHVFHSVLRVARAQGFEGIKQPRAYIRRIARNAFWDAIRGARKSERGYPLFEEKWASSLEASPSMQAERKEEIKSLHKAIATLPVADRTVLTMSAAGKSTREKANALGTQTTTARTRQLRAFLHLERALPESHAV